MVEKNGEHALNVGRFAVQEVTPMSTPAIVRIPRAGNLKYALGPGEPFIGEIEPGKPFEVECEINCNGGVITSLDTQRTFDSMKIPWVNPATGPIRVVGAEPGQALAVT